MPAWQTLEKTFPLREQIKASLKQASYCSTSWVAASKKQSDEYLAVSVTESIKLSENFILFCLGFFAFFSPDSKTKGRAGKAEVISIAGCLQGRAQGQG